jgi:mRNA-degrading endonuclease toxin of MazEF toxin-antitoxin module
MPNDRVALASLPPQLLRRPAAGSRSGGPRERLALDKAVEGTEMDRGTVVTLNVNKAVGGEKRGSHPAVVVSDFGPCVLVVPVTEANKSRLPTHHFLRNFASGTQIKDALVTCEHAMSVDPSRLEQREGAAALGPPQVPGIVKVLEIAVGIAPTPTKPPAQAQHRRGAFVTVDFGSGAGIEPSGVVSALIVSNDTGNYFGRHFLVVPVAGPNPVRPVRLASWPSSDEPEAVDIALLRVVDRDRLRPSDSAQATTVDLAAVDKELSQLLHKQ